MRRRILTGARVRAGVRALAGCALAGLVQAAAHAATPQLYVLGGPAAVPDAVAARTAELSGAAVSRLSGPDRYATAAAVSRAHVDRAPAVVLASGEAFADALAAAPAAAALGGPVLLSARTALPGATERELARLSPQRVLLAGGPAAVGPGVAARLAALGYAVERVAGAERTATAVALARLVAPGGAPTVFVASARQAADALAGSLPAAARRAPILLVEPAGVSAAVRAEAARLRPSELVVLGGPAAVPPDSVAALAAATGARVTRLSGPGRAATSARIAQAFAPDGADAVFVADGGRFADALAVGAVAWRAPAGHGARTQAARARTAVLLYTGGPGDEVAAELRRLGEASPRAAAGPAPAASPSATPAPSPPSPPPGGLGGGGGAGAAPLVDLDPAAGGSGATVAFTEDDAPVTLAPAATLTDGDSATLRELAVTVSGNPDGAAESLTVPGALPAGVAGSYDAATATLTLSGEAPVADYQAALRQVAYANTSQSPDAGPRAVAVTVTDATGASAAATATVTVTPVNDAPTPLEDRYDADAPLFGNVLFVASDGTPAEPGAVAVTRHTRTLLGNDTDPDGDSLTVTELAVDSGDGTVWLLDAATGAFAYEPHAPGTHVLRYRVSDGALTAAADVTLEVTGRVWFVDDGAAGDGRSTAPAADLATVAAADAPGDVLFVFAGRDGAALAAGVALEQDAQLLGQPHGLALTDHLGINRTLVAAGGEKPLLAAPGATALTLASGARVAQLEIGDAAVGIAGTAAAETATLEDVVVTAETGVALSGGAYRLAGDVAVTATAGDALAATGGTLTASGGGNTLDATGGAALRVDGSVVSGGLSFRSVSADGGANAILFDPANGSDGASLSVTGSTADGSGGVIRASSGDAVVVGGGSVSLARMRVEDGAGRAIAADGAASVSLTRVTLSGNGGAGGLPTVDLAETTGAVTIMSSTLSAGSGDLLRVAASATTPTVTVYQSTFSDGDGAGLLVEADADGAVSATVSGSTFDGLAGPGVRWRAGLSPGADGHSLLTVVSSAFRDRAGAGGSHLALELGASSATTAVLGAAGQPNTFDTVGGTGAAAIQLDVSGGAVLEATVAASTIDAPRGRGLALEAAQAADVTLLVDANTIRDAVAEALWAAAGAGDGDSAVDVTVTANQVSGANAGAAALAAIAVESAEHTLCADVSGNTVTATAGGAFDVVLRAVDPGLLRYAMAGSGTVTDADVVARNTIGAAQVTGAGVSGSGGAACRLP